MSALGYEEYWDTGILFTGEAQEALERTRGDERQLDELTPAEIQALTILHEQQNGLMAYAHMAMELGLDPSAPVQDVKAALEARDITLDEATDWLPACNYDIDCFRQTLFWELRQGRRRVAEARAKRLTIGAAVVTLGAALWLRRKKR